MKILHVLASNRFAGAERVAVNIIRNMPEYNCIYVSPPGPIEEQLKNLGIEYHPIKRLTPWDLRRVISELRPDIIHAHDYRAGVMSSGFSKRVRVISHLHSNYPWAKSINAKTLLYGRQIPRFHKIIMVSESIRDEFIWQNQINSRGVVIANVIDIQEVIHLSNLYCADSSDLLFVGRLTEPKAPLDFISLVAELKKSHPSISAVILGEGELQVRCQAEIDRLDLNDHIHMAGFQENPFPFIIAGKILVIPSKWEGFGMAAMEAMALGRPVIANSTGGLTKMILPGRTGYLCTEFEEMVEMTNLLLNNKVLWQEMSKQAGKWAADKNDMEAYISSIKKIYGINN